MSNTYAAWNPTAVDDSSVSVCSALWLNALCDIHLQGFQKQRPLVAESVIRALPPDVHDAHQVVGGCGGKALLRKKAYRLPKRFLLIKLLRSSHAPLLFYISL